MKLNYVMFGLIALMIISHALGIPIGAPIIIVLLYPFIANGFNFIKACFMALVNIATQRSLHAEALKATAKEIRINENMGRLRQLIYGDKPSTFILNDRSEQFRQQFDNLTTLEPDAEFEISSYFEFGNADRIIHKVEAKTPTAIAMLTSLKTALIKGGTDLNFS